MLKSVEKGGGGKCEIFQYPVALISMGHGIKAQPIPMKNPIIPNLSTARAPGSTLPPASWFRGRNSCLVGNYVMPLGYGFLLYYSTNDADRGILEVNYTFLS